MMVSFFITESYFRLRNKQNLVLGDSKCVSSEYLEVCDSIKLLRKTQDPREQTPQFPAERSDVSVSVRVLPVRSSMAFQGYAFVSQHLHNPETPSTVYYTIILFSVQQCIFPVSLLCVIPIFAAVTHCLRWCNQCYKSMHWDTRP